MIDGKSKPQKGINNTTSYTILKKWFLNKIDDDVITESFVKQINIMNVLCMLARDNKMCVFINNYYNNWNIMNIDKIEVLKSLKQMIRDFGVKSLKFSYLRINKNTLNKNILQFFPLLKNKEIEFLMELVKSDSRVNSIHETLGLAINQNK